MGVLAAAAGVALAGAGQASAGPDVCVTGPWGYVTTCADVPVVDVWDGHRGPGYWNRGPGGPGHWHDHDR